MRIKIALVVFATGLAGWLYASGAYEIIDPERLRRWLQDAGAWGGVLFVMAYCGLQPLGVRSIFFLLSAPMVWDPATAFFLSLAGTLGASLAAFGFARFVARDWVQRRLPQGIRRLDARLTTHGFRTVLLLRLLFYTTPTVQYGLGVSSVAVRPFLLGTVLGVMPFTGLVTSLGVRMNRWLADHPLSTWPWDRFGVLIVLLAIAVLISGLLLARKWRHKLSFEDSSPVRLSMEQES